MITFAIPFYRDAGLLRRAVASVLAQTVEEWRLVIFDEGVEPFEPFWDDARVSRVVNPRPLGMAENWNQCLAAGSPVCILHADDELLPHYAALMEEAFRQHPDAAACFCRARVIGVRFSLADWVKQWLPRPPVLRGEDGARALLRGNFIMCPTLCYRPGALRFSARWKMVLDLDFVLRTLLAGGSLVEVPAVGYLYRRHPGSATKEYTRSGLRFAEEVALHEEMAAACTLRGWKRAARMARWRPFVRLHRWWRLLF